MSAVGVVCNFQLGAVGAVCILNLGAVGGKARGEGDR